MMSESEQLGYLRNMFPLSEQKIAEARRRRWRLQSMAAKLLPSYRVANCYRRISDKANNVGIHYDEHTHRAFYSGLMTCGSVWTCPVCSAKITEQRRQELTQAVEAWRSNGGSLVMVTITLAHHHGDELKKLLTALKDSWRRLKSGRAWLSLRARYQLAHYVSSTEVTFGENGWHPHIHCLMFSTLPEPELDTDALKTELTERYNALLAQHGKYASDFYGLDVRIGDDFCGEYASKYGLERELTKSIGKNGKNGSSPWQLLEQCQAGDKQAGALFQEYARVFFGARQLSWSHGARKALKLGVELTDEQLAAAEPESESVCLATLTPAQYRLVCLAELRGEVLEIASRGDSAYLWRYLHATVGVAPPEPPRILTAAAFGV